MARTRPVEGDRGTAGALLRAGTRLFARGGYDGTSVRAITRAAGVNLGAVTYHYGSKRDLYSAVLESVLSPLGERVRAAARLEAPPLERIEAVLRGFFQHLAEYPEQPQLLLQEIAAGKTPPRAAREIAGGVLAALTRIVAEGQEDGTIRPGDPLLMALSVMSQPVYMSVVAPLAQQVIGLDLKDPEIRQRAVDHAVLFARRGLASHPPTLPEAP